MCAVRLGTSTLGTGNAVSLLWDVKVPSQPGIRVTQAFSAGRRLVLDLDTYRGFGGQEELIEGQTHPYLVASGDLGIIGRRR